MSDFFDSVEIRRNLIDELPIHFRSKLLLLLLDALSKCAYPRTNGNKKRFIKLINNYSKWKDKDRLSLPQLYLSLAHKRQHRKLYQEVKKRLSTWPTGKIISPQYDPFFRDFSRLANASEKVILNKHRYSHLLWSKRNFEVHEFRSPGRGWAIVNDSTSPYYHGILGTHRMHFVIPVGFISNLVKDCNENLKRKLKTLGVDPLNRLPIRDSWV